MSPISSLKQTSLNENGFTVINKDDKLKGTSISKSPNKLNAFQIMMTSRNKSIGTNSSGKKPEDDGIGIDITQSDKKKVKRKLMLENWAESKGGAKRKLQEEAKDEFIQHELKKRAKRFKKLIKGDVEIEIIDTPKEKPLQKSLFIGKKRTRRISSTDSIESDSSQIPVVIDEFVEKLASPMKKRDSLLGYFEKIVKNDESPETENVDSQTTEIISDTPKGRKKRMPRRNGSLSGELVDNKILEQVQPQLGCVTTPTSRPRRQCCQNIKSYNISPEALQESDKNNFNQIVSPLKIINIHSPRPLRVVKVHSIEIHDNYEDDVENVMPKKNVKLAPLFNKVMPKAKVDPEVDRLRQAFLMSGIPDKLRIEIENKKMFEETLLSDSPIFPIISHVQQIDSISDMHVNADGFSNFKLKFRATESDTNDYVQNNYGKIPPGMLIDCTPKQSKLKDEVNISVEVPNLEIKSIIQNFKKSFDKFPVYRCYKQMRDKCNCVDNQTNSNMQSLFTDKYKPHGVDDILVNYTQVNKLKKFLSSWQQNDDSKQFSDDDFENSSMSLPAISNNFIVLIGPPSSGKTSSVSAVANDLNFNILEINLSSKRNGKKILQELQEATQSHKVGSQDDNITLKKIFKQRSLMGQSQDSNCSSSSVGNGSKKISLILIEDADVVFEQDDGFVNAINQLIATSKRPVILTASDINANHLLKYIHQNCILYKLPNLKNISRWLSIMSLCENYLIDLNEIEKLFIFNNCDLRKTINEMQFFMKSGGDQELRRISGSTSDAVNSIHKNVYTVFTKNQNLDHMLKYPLNFDNIWCNMSNSLVHFGVQSKGPEAPGKNNEKSEIENLLFLYENISIGCHINNDEWNADRTVPYLDEEISHYLVESTIKQCNLASSTGDEWNYDELKTFNKHKRYEINFKILLIFTKLIFEIAENL